MLSGDTVIAGVEEGVLLAESFGVEVIFEQPHTVQLYIAFPVLSIVDSSNITPLSHE